jgi:BirA family biotin operon repressor/biotin-[acetyl-CoA-carboxylase] ligase
MEPKPLTFSLLRLLADGEFHSGEVLAQQLGVSRASVNNALQGVEQYGLTLYSVRGRGYRLLDSPQWLDVSRIRVLLGARATGFNIEIADSALSSNTLMLQQIGRAHV